MTERHGTAGLADLEAALRQLGTEVAYPPAEGLAVAVRARIDALPARRRSWRDRLVERRGVPRLRLGLVLAILAIALLAAVAGAALLGLPGLRVVFGPVATPTTGPGTIPSPIASQPSPAASVPSASATPSGSPSLGAALRLGDAVDGDPDAAAGFAVQLPSDPALGPPDAAYVQRTPSGPVVSVVWGEREGIPASMVDGTAMLMAEFEGRIGTEYFAKIVDQGAVITPVEVNGARGYWLTGPVHMLYVVGPDGEMLPQEPRVVGDVLMWRSGGLTLRLEGAPDMETALRIAESTR